MIRCTAEMQATIAQVQAGAHMLDVNAGVPLADEPQMLYDCIKLVQSLTDAPLSIDSSIVAALEKGLEAYVGKPLVNSVTGEEERLEVVLPLVAKYNAAVVEATRGRPVCRAQHLRELQVATITAREVAVANRAVAATVSPPAT